MSQYQKGKTNLDFTEARDGEWQRHQLGHMQVCTSLLTDNHDSTPPLSFLQAGYPSCDPTNSVKALKAQALKALKRMTSVMTIPLQTEDVIVRVGLPVRDAFENARLKCALSIHLHVLVRRSYVLYFRTRIYGYIYEILHCGMLQSQGHYLQKNAKPLLR